MIPRVYQEYIYEGALKENTIAFVPTGMGKTLVSVMLIQHYSDTVQNKNIIFLAPTIPLVEQQASYIRENTNNLKIASFAGETEYFWALNNWKNQISELDIVVMTPMLFLNVLVAGFHSLSNVSLLIFDECHHCTKKHPYNIIFTDFYFDCPEQDRPRIFGMTASPVAISIVQPSLQELGECKICNIKFYSETQKSQHLLGSKHRKRTLRDPTLLITSITDTSTCKNAQEQKNIDKQKDSIEIALKQLEMRMDSRLILPDPESNDFQNYCSDPKEENINYKELSNEAISEIFAAMQMAFTSIWPTVPTYLLELSVFRDTYHGNRPHNWQEIESQSQNLFPFNFFDFRRLYGICKELGSVSLFLYLDIQMQEVEEQRKEIKNFFLDFQFRLFVIIESQLYQKENLNLFSPKIKKLFSVLHRFNEDVNIIRTNDNDTFGIDGDCNDTQSTLRTDSMRKENRMIVFVKERNTARLLKTIIAGNLKLSLPKKPRIYAAQYSAQNISDLPKRCCSIPIEQILRYYPQKNGNVKIKDHNTNILTEKAGNAKISVQIEQIEQVLQVQREQTEHNETKTQHVQLLLGRTTKTKGKKILEEFACGDCQIIIATSVAEEGIDISSCNYVICFDGEYLGVKSYIQRKGRARHSNSHLFFFSPQENLYNLREQETMISLIAHNRTRQPRTQISSSNETFRYFESICSPLGAKITEHTAKQVLNHYISLLPGDSYWKPSVYFKSWKVNETSFRASCFLPANCPLEEEKFDSARDSSTRKGAEESAAIAVCRELYKQNILNDNFLPFAELEAASQFLEETNCNDEDSQDELFAPPPIALDWKPISLPCILETSKTTLYSTKILIKGEEAKIKENQQNEVPERYIFFLSHKNFTKEIHIPRGSKLKVTIFPSSPKLLTATELQEFFQIHRVLLSYHNISTVKRFNFDSNQQTSVISHCIKNHYCSTKQQNSHEHGQQREQELYLQYFPGVSLQQMQYSAPIKHFCDPKKLATEIQNKLAWIVGDSIKMLWYINNIEENESPCSIMTKDWDTGKEISFSEHYQSKYSIALEEIIDEQPLISISRIHKTKNFEEKENYWKSKTNLSAIPQHCKLFPISISQFQAVQILPSIMWQLNQILLADEFVLTCSLDSPLLCDSFEDWDDSLPRKLLNAAGCHSLAREQTSKRQVFLLLLQMAFSSPSASNKFNYELLETLGDSFLKYIISDYLYTNHPNQHEGILTSMRTKIISNRNLHRLAVQRNLQRFLITTHVSPLQLDSPAQPIPIKRLADVTEALIGVFLLYGGWKGARRFLRWIGIPCFSVDHEIVIPKPLKREGNYKPVDLFSLEQGIGYRFKDWNLGNIARTHASFAHGSQCFQRLEFLGDAVLDFLVTLYFFNKFADELSPHTLTALRSDTVSNNTFAKAIMEKNLHRFIRHNSKFISKHLEKFEKHVLNMENESGASDFLLSLKYRTPKIVADVLEALAGAVFLDAAKDTRAVWKVFFPMLRKQNLTVQSLHKHPIVILYQLQGKDVQINKTMKVERDLREHRFEITFLANKEFLFCSVDKNKASSSTGAAIGALSLLFDIAVKALT